MFQSWGNDCFSFSLIFDRCLTYVSTRLKCFVCSFFLKFFLWAISVQETDLSATCSNKSQFFVVQGDHHERLAVTLNLCLTNGPVVSRILACLVTEFGDKVKVNDPHEQLLTACPSFVRQYLWPRSKQWRRTSPSEKMIISVVSKRDGTHYLQPFHSSKSWNPIVM